jgi:hypothetical protein
MKLSTRRWSLIGVLVALCLTFSSMGALADDETAAAGNGGTADGYANGGAAALGDLNSGGNSGNAIAMGDTGGGEIGGGSVANATDLGVGVDGGTGIADASGGESNIAFTLDPVPPAPAPGPDPEPEPPVEEFQVCVTFAGFPEVCGSGSCTGPNNAADCTVDDCGALNPPVSESPCNFGNCEVIGNTGFCFVEPG